MTHGHEEEQLVTGHSGRLLISIVFGTMLVMSGQLLLAPLLPAIIDDLSISTAAAGVAVTVMWSVGALFRYVGGLLADGLSSKTVLVASLGVLAGGAGLLTVAVSYPLLLVGAATFGVGSGLYFIAAVTRISDLFTESKGQAFGFYEASLNIGGILSAVLGTAVLAHTSWRFAFSGFVVLFVALMALLHQWDHDSYDLSWPDVDVRESGLDLLETNQVPSLLLVAALFSFVWQGTTNFFPTLLQVEKGMEPAVANGAFAMLFVVGIPVNLGAGRVGDRIGYVLAATGAVLTGAVGLGLLLVPGPFWLVPAGTGLFAIGLSGFWPNVLPYLMGRFPASSRGANYGAVSTGYLLAGSLGPTYLGTVANHATYTLGFAGFVVGLVATAAVLFGVIRNG